MSLKPQPQHPIPAETKALVGKMLDEGTVYRFVGDVLFDRFHDADFADLYSHTGRPAVSPVLLSFVLIFKSLERCSNREKDAADGHMRWNEDGERGGSQVIETPYDPEARWATKRSQDWIGYKLQVTETDDADYPHLITDIALTNAAESDMAALEAIRARQQEQDSLPSERFVDSGYVSGELLLDGRQDYEEELVGPIRGTATPQTKIPDGLTHADFVVDWEGKRVTCPAGHTTVIFTNGKRSELQATFKAKLCRACPLQPRCCTGTKKGRSLRFGSHYPQTQELRQRQKTDAFKQAYGRHRSGIEACLSALMRGQSLRTTRHIGRRNNQLHALCAGAAVNLARCAAWRGGYRPIKRVTRLGLVVGGASEAPALALAA